MPLKNENDMLLEKQNSLQHAKVNINLSYSKEHTTIIIEDTYEDYFERLFKLRESLIRVAASLGSEIRKSNKIQTPIYKIGRSVCLWIGLSIIYRVGYQNLHSFKHTSEPQ